MMYQRTVPAGPLMDKSETLRHVAWLMLNGDRSAFWAAVQDLESADTVLPVDDMTQLLRALMQNPEAIRWQADTHKITAVAISSSVH